MKLEVSTALHDLPFINTADLYDLQGNLKDLTEKNYKLLKKSIEKEGFIIPLFVWFEPESGVPYTLDGNQRCRVIRTEFPDGVELPYIEVHATDKADAKKKILLISSQYGETTKEGFDEFVAEIPDTSFIKDLTTFTDFLDKEIKNAPSGGGDDSGGGAADYETKFVLEITAKDEATQQEMYNEMIERGFTCRVLTL
ncbi:ParB N-terminal domain-containing protein [Tellurirhabdus bombi]|uniref:hypothetical protein n=1 Tax=Tellurirhabdus bombi TaxID=2907205 RepID=UPI001F38E090|nr:hypothetical protein [Tellurirhabdus bombi]